MIDLRFPKFIIACFAAFEQNVLHQILKVASILPWHLSYAFFSIYNKSASFLTDFKSQWLVQHVKKKTVC